MSFAKAGGRSGRSSGLRAAPPDPRTTRTSLVEPRRSTGHTLRLVAKLPGDAAKRSRHQRPVAVASPLWAAGTFSLVDDSRRLRQKLCKSTADRDGALPTPQYASNWCRNPNVTRGAQAPGEMAPSGSDSTNASSVPRNPSIAAGRRPPVGRRRSSPGLRSEMIASAQAPPRASDLFLRTAPRFPGVVHRHSTLQPWPRTPARAPTM